MEEQIKNKWENWASNLHDSDDYSTAEIDESDAEFKYARQIFEARNLVAQLDRLKSTNTSWYELKGRIHQGRNPWLVVSRYAAVFVFAVALTGTWFWWQSPKPEIVFASISAPVGQISNVTLFDGTNVWLNAGSSLKYGQSFGMDNRDVYLEGEAFFSVTKNQRIPFVVHAGNSSIKVHGTQFNVKAYGNDPVVEAVLVEGKVEFLSDSRTVMMSPGEQLRYSTESRIVELKDVDTNELTSWKGGKIYFNNESLINLTNQLERWYEVRFQFDNDRIKDYRFSGVINKDRSLDYTLDIIQEINKVKFKTNKEQIIIMDK